MSSRKKIFSSAGIVSSATLLSRILGFIRDMVIASFFGAGMASDAFFVAFRIPNLLRRLLAEGSLTSAYIPVFTEILNKNGKKEASDFAEKSFRFFFLVLILITITGVVLSPVLVKITAPGFFENLRKASLAVSLTRLMFPYIFFICLVALSMGILNSLGHFLAPAFAPVFLNISMIASVFVLGGLFSHPIYGLAVGVLIGGFVQLLFQLPFLIKKGVNPFRGIAIWHPAIFKVTMLMGPTLFGAAVYQISILVNTLLASFLPEGSVSYLYYSDRLVQFPLALFGITAGIVILPLMSQQVADGKYNELRTTLSEGISFIFFITIPATIGLIAIGRPLISILFQRGAFDEVMAMNTYIAMVAYSIGLFAASGTRILVSFFYSLKDTKTPVKVGILSFVVNIVLAFGLMPFFSFYGLAFAVSCGSIVNFSILMFKVNGKLERGVNFKKILSRVIYMILAAFLMGVFIFFLDIFIVRYSGIMYGVNILRVVLELLSGVVIYFIFAIFLKIPETSVVVKLLSGKLK